MNTNDMIEITGCDLKEVAKAVYDLSHPVGMGILHYRERPLTDEEAEKVVSLSGGGFALDMDYVNGRACKFSVIEEDGKLYMFDTWLDHTESDLLKLIDRLGV